MPLPRSGVRNLTRLLQNTAILGPSHRLEYLVCRQYHQDHQFQSQASDGTKTQPHTNLHLCEAFRSRIKQWSSTLPRYHEKGSDQEELSFFTSEDDDLTEGEETEDEEDEEDMEAQDDEELKAQNDQEDDQNDQELKAQNDQEEADAKKERRRQRELRNFDKDRSKRLVRFALKPDIYKKLSEAGVVSSRFKRPLPVLKLAKKSDVEIVGWFLLLSKELLQYFRACYNLKEVKSIVEIHIRWSAIKTLAKKHWLTDRQIVSKYGRDLECIDENGNKVRLMTKHEIKTMGKRKDLGVKTNHSSSALRILASMD